MRAWLARMLSPNLSLQSCPRMENILRCSLEWGGSLPGGRWQVQELTNGVSVIVVGAHCDAGQWSSPPCWSAQGRPAQRRGQQGGIILVNLSTRLTRNLKTSHKILVGSPALCRENKLWAKYHRSKVLVTRIKLLSQEMNKCHRNKVPMAQSPTVSGSL